MSYICIYIYLIHILSLHKNHSYSGIKPHLSFWELITFGVVR